MNVNFSGFNYLTIAVLIFLVCNLPQLCPAEDEIPDWDSAVADSSGQTVNWYMWGGSPAVNRYVNGYLARELKNRFNINLRQVPVKDIAEIVSKLMVEKAAGKNSGGSVDLMWINGENFRTCKRENLLFGPFADVLPNQRFVDWHNPAVENDFGTPVAGMESPWGSAQFVMIYDSARTPDPPTTIADLIRWIIKHPGRFSYPAPPDFTGSAFVRHFFYHTGAPEKWQQGYNEAELKESADSTYAILNDLKPFLWREGSTYPDSPVRLNSLFVDNEIDFSFSYHQGEATRNILDGIFPDTVRTYVFDEGTIANTHFVAIPFNAENKEGAMVVANFLLSPEAQYKKAEPDVWGDFPVVSTTRLPVEWQEKFNTRPRGVATLDDQQLQSHQLPEPPSDILVYLEKGWENQVLKSR
ncbi:ABC transporter substrate-binding protein [Desulforhopalus singaporensis]|uniref:Putative spermidine/putrescine transport system substrate-binding protein n=1 Tax=Desulforhopalus singaporensis TaxID=91360 RepID=A0A1H0SWN5_9BACT|nr:ABC transporter substrate-binding protein [Desulforhopalus singaporensis]SDP46187.1 putative spermidine/putrescine transport system substrate-binding protein [Desulforhopalus singaporensis]